MKTREKIIQTSIDLFNRQGVVAVTTNHIARALQMSPGNLYFHFRNREEIIREIFSALRKETYSVCRKGGGKSASVLPLEFIEKNYELYWKYRFFHREMYYLRRKDVQLAKLWKSHIRQFQKLLLVAHRRWVKMGLMLPLKTKEEGEFLSSVLLSTASTFMHFFESAERLPQREQLTKGKQYVAWLMIHWTTGTARTDFERFIGESRNA